MAVVEGLDQEILDQENLGRNHVIDFSNRFKVITNFVRPIDYLYIINKSMEVAVCNACLVRIRASEI